MKSESRPHTGVQSRREFLRSAGAFAVSASLPLDRIEPELILYNGNIITINDRQPRAEAVAIANGRFLAVGTNEALQALTTGQTKKINLEGQTVVPGFIDATCDR
jgi:adenine deaminase